MTMPDTPALAALREAEARAIGLVRSQSCCCEDAADGPAEVLVAARIKLDYDLDRLVDAVAARVREELLASGTPLWVATDGKGDSWCCTLSNPADVDAPGEWMPLEGPLTPPGTCRRAVLTILPEEGEGNG